MNFRMALLCFEFRSRIVVILISLIISLNVCQNSTRSSEKFEYNLNKYTITTLFQVPLYSFWQK